MSEKYKDIIIGLEVHIQLTNLKTKLFCSCSTDYRGEEQNTHVCPICLGLPGSLPVVNKMAIEFATRLALALDCKINNEMYFFRKNYFYPDMSKNFQITMYNKAGGKAFGDGGKIIIKLDGKKKDIMLDRIHLEEDPARLVHKGSIATSPYTLVDYNRSGVTLIEIVSDPVMNSPEEAREYLRQLKSIVQYTGIADLDFEGSCRVDANISIKGHARSEVKNINGFKEVERALKWEIQRQKNLLKRGKELFQETRHWDDKRRVTIGLRKKEFEKDYRYFPEQDLVPIRIDQKFISRVKKELPEMPNDRMKRFQNEYKLSDCNWLMGEISRWLNDNNKSIKETQLTPKILIDLIKNINNGKITGKIAKTYVDVMMKGTEIIEIMKKSGKKRISDKDKITKVVKEVLEENYKIVEDYKKNPKALQALIGKCMQKTKGQLDPKITKDIMLKLIKK
jgi:aspartyl-tRNA(Asn)/glutamyl-tRNA(Gln) amidotransferase subunit B